jgi:hypothetical protein
MSEEDQAMLEKHLKQGGAALAAMLDAEEMEATVYELGQLGADVDTYNVPQEVLDDMERVASSEAVIHELAEKYEKPDTE